LGGKLALRKCHEQRQDFIQGLRFCKAFVDGVNMKQIINLSAVQTAPVGNGGKFVADFASIGALIGAKKLGVSVAVVPPGKRAFPKHAHHVNEEMMYVLEGRGTYHCGAESAPIRAGDLIAAPPGNGATAHQIENTSSAPLTYLTFSTKLEPEVVEYPDSGKFAVSSFAGADKPVVRFIGRREATLDYYDGEG
jgi:uncharacterized cupin superfamily protein